MITEITIILPSDENETSGIKKTISYENEFQQQSQCRFFHSGSDTVILLVIILAFTGKLMPEKIQRMQMINLQLNFRPQQKGRRVCIRIPKPAV
jgi:hypothetical protein